MPIYEYLCPACNGRFQKLVRGFNPPADLRCPRCGNREVRKAVSRFALAQSEEARLESLADPSALAGLDENDPQSIARWAKKMGKELGEDLGDDWDEMVDQMLEEELNGGGEEGEHSTPPDDLGWD
ncbi:FmdB family zinc ribbon protein [Kallotenue papyrolyticum]|uniref:FmdB family zinc ribbon protein n=1 Tax=Kallotenue papyrolyticum TaxID=1325125 RepID=UPI0004785DAD|nr:zinc ribbon domain-containing protein [Kallotenue papyrolyticum]